MSTVVQVSKPLPEPMLTQIYIDIWRHKAIMCWSIADTPWQVMLYLRNVQRHTDTEIKQNYYIYVSKTEINLKLKKHGMLNK